MMSFILSQKTCAEDAPRKSILPISLRAKRSVNMADRPFKTVKSSNSKQPWTNWRN